MKEVIIEGLTEQDLALLKEIVGSYNVTVSEFSRIERIKELDDKLAQILTYLSE